MKDVKRRYARKVKAYLSECGLCTGDDLKAEPGRRETVKKKMHAVKSMERRFEKENENMTEMPEQEGAIFFKLGNKEAAIPAGKTVIEYELPELWTPDGERILADNIFLRIRGSEKICITGKKWSR